jgi:anaerobic dimethyl sulfoxide reductase subunit B (iron-sulfur subunit)
LRRVKVYESGTWPKVQTQALSSACNHCENAWCMKACPVKAIWRRDETGSVLINYEACVGCQQCSMFCPYDAPQFNTRTRRMEKCTGCFDRIDEGLQPACATLCPTEALRWGKWDEIKGQGVAQVPNFSNPKNTVPHMRFVVDGFGKK